MKLFITSTCTVLSVSLLTLSTTGCVATTGSMVRYNDTADPCYSYRQPLIESEDQLGRRMVTGALVGAGTGAAAALLTRKDKKDALIGAVIGGIAGATVGYFQGLEEKQLTQAQMLQEINNDAGRDAGKISQTRGLIGSLNQCRNRQIDQVEAEFKAGRINNAGVVSRVTVIKAAADADNELISKVLGHAYKRSNTYVDAAARAQGVSQDMVLGDVQYYQTAPTSPALAATAAGPAQRYVAKASSNVREAPSTSARSLGGLATGQRLSVTSVQGDWMEVLFNGQRAYVHKSLVAPEGSNEARTAIASARKAQAAPKAQAAAPKPANDIQKVALETRVAKAEAEAGQQKIAARLDDLLLLGGQTRPTAG